MAKNGKSTARAKWKLVLLAAGRNRRRIARLGKRYRPDRWAAEHRPQTNPKFRSKGKAKGVKRVVLPSTLDISTPANTQVLFEMLGEIRESVLRRRYRRVVLDHSRLSTLAPEAALVLLAEIQRCRLYCGKKSQLTGTYPASKTVSRLLDDVGFYEALGIRSPNFQPIANGRNYVKVERHNRTLARVIDSLLSCFAQEFNFVTEDRKRLQVALVECMDNVFEHAYAVDSMEPYLFREWWMIGYSDHTDGSISFTFYDQGAGIAATIKQRQASRVLRLLSGWTDGDWLERAIRKPISRHESVRRGHGLNKLKSFVDRLGFDGDLRVIANHGDVDFRAGGSKVVLNHASPLHGSLIVWTLKPKTVATSQVQVAAITIDGG